MDCADLRTSCHTRTHGETGLADLISRASSKMKKNLTCLIIMVKVSPRPFKVIFRSAAEDLTAVQAHIHMEQGLLERLDP